MKTNSQRHTEWRTRQWYCDARQGTPPLRLVRCTPRLRDRPWFRDNFDATVAFLGTWFLLAAAAWVLGHL